MRGAMPYLDRQAARPERAREGRSRGDDRTRRRASRPLGRGPHGVGERPPDLALRPGGPAGAVRQGGEAAHHEVGRRRRQLHLARPDGLGHQQGDRGLHRRRPPLDRRPVPPKEDRERASRRHHRRRGAFPARAHQTPPPRLRRTGGRRRVNATGDISLPNDSVSWRGPLVRPVSRCRRARGPKP